MSIVKYFFCGHYICVFCLLFDVSEMLKSMLKSMLKMLKSKLESENNAFLKKKKYITHQGFFMNLLRLVSLAVVGAEVQCQGVREEMEQAWD